MNTQWTAEQLAIRVAFAEIGLRIGAAASNCRHEKRLDREGWRFVSEAGLFGMAVKREYGGRGGTWWDFAAALEGLSSTARDLGFLLSIIAHMGAIRLISEKGSCVQKERYLPRLVAGHVASTATTEASGGSDVSRIRTGVHDRDGNLRLYGTKTHITNAPVADIFIILGRIPALGERRDITLFILERGAEGLRTGPAEVMLGNPTSPTGDIVLDGVFINPENIIQPAGEGLALLYSMLTLDRLLYALVSAGYLEPMLNAAVARASERHAFKRPLSEHQYVQDKIVTIKLAMEEARFLSYAALDRMLSGAPDALLMGSVAKLVGCERLWEAACEYLQLHGHHGYMSPAITDILRDTVATRIAGGTSEMQKVNIFNQIRHLAAQSANTLGA